MKSIHVFFRQNGGIDAGSTDLRRQRRLHENAMNAGIGIQLVKEGEQFCFARILWKDSGFRKDAKPGARPLLHPDIDLRGWVFAHSHESKAGLDASRFESADSGTRFSVNLLRYGASIDEIGKRHQGTVSIFSTSITGVLGQRSSSISSPVTRMRCPR